VLPGREAPCCPGARHHGGVHVVAAPDKFRGTMTAAEAAAAVARAAAAAGWSCDEAPVADGGEGTLAVLGGGNRRTTVSGPLGDAVDAEWRFAGDTAVIEMAKASGLALVDGPGGNDPMAASTHGTGELIAAAMDAGCRRIVVGMGGSATTDGGLGALRALEPLARMRGVRLVAACDVWTPFLKAADAFAPQKGATPPQVELLRRRLERLAQLYADEYGVDVRALPGSGAAGGLAGGLAAVGADLVPGFDMVAEEIELFDRVATADLVVTGEGFLDEESFNGKAVGGVVDVASHAGAGVLVVAGDALDGVSVPRGVRVVSLTARFGVERALADTPRCIEAVVAEHLARPPA
jgi:glycerate kinase